MPQQFDLAVIGSETAAVVRGNRDFLALPSHSQIYRFMPVPKTFSGTNRASLPAKAGPEIYPGECCGPQNHPHITFR
jgi:hypothetical protein